MNADPKREAPTSVGASSSGTAFSRGRNSCNATFHGKMLFGPKRTAIGPSAEPLESDLPDGS